MSEETPTARYQIVDDRLFEVDRYKDCTIEELDEIDDSIHILWSNNFNTFQLIFSRFIFEWEVWISVHYYESEISRRKLIFQDKASSKSRDFWDHMTKVVQQNCKEKYEKAEQKFNTFIQQLEQPQFKLESKSPLDEILKKLENHDI